MSGDSEELSPFEAEVLRSVLELLRWNWGDAYIINHAHGQFTAARRDGRGDLLCAAGEQSMYDMLADDYHACPVPRDLPRRSRASRYGQRPFALS